MSFMVHFEGSTPMICWMIGDEMFSGNQLTIDRSLFMSHLVKKGRFSESNVWIICSVKAFVKLDIVLDWYIGTFYHHQEICWRLVVYRILSRLYAGRSPRCSQANRHYSDDVIMVGMASLITSLTIVYSTVYSDADQRKHQNCVPLAFVPGILFSGG